MSTEPISQPIVEIILGDLGEGVETYKVDRGGCTRIEPIEKNGEYCMIPWVRVWAGEVVLFEACQHRLVGIVYGPPAS